MIFEATPLEGAHRILPQPIPDERGFFARSWCRNEFAERGLRTDLAQCNISFNRLKGTLRGMHYQVPPHAETKLVRCTRGAVYDVLLDIRKSSPSFGRHFGAILDPAGMAMLYIPEGVAHGFLSLEDDTEVFYQISEFYHPESAKGIRWDDPAFGIHWPGEVAVISDRDRNWPDFAP